MVRDGETADAHAKKEGESLELSSNISRKIIADTFVLLGFHNDLPVIKLLNTLEFYKYYDDNNK